MSAPPGNPVTADQIRPGDPYEISEGRLIECLPSARRGARSNAVGGVVLDSDPSVESAGVDTGFSPRPETLRALDISVGNVPDEPGWATEAPLLAVEYADTGQDEADLQQKIRELLAAGTRWIWVVRLQNPRRVEVYEARKPAVRVAFPGEVLTAPGVLKNPVPVEALYDRDAAHEVTLRNLLQRKGYESLDAVLAAGHAEGLRTGVRDLCELLGIELSPDREAELEAMDVAALLALRHLLKKERRWA